MVACLVRGTIGNLHAEKRNRSEDQRSCVVALDLEKA